MLRVSSTGLELIKRFEGFSAIPYLCPAGYWTIGWGHVLSDDEASQWKVGIGEQEATRLLRQDVKLAGDAVGRLIQVALSQGQYDALVSFTYNLGAGALQRSGVRRKLNREEYEEVPAELRRWIWAGGRRLEGLIRRREAEIKIYLT